MQELDSYLLKKKASGLIGKFLFLTLVFGICFAILYPLLKLFPLVFGDIHNLGNPDVIWIPEKVSVVSFKAAIRIVMGNSFMPMIQSLIYAITVMIVQVFASAMVGYSLARVKFFGSKFIFFLVLLTFVVPPQSLLISQYIHFKNFDILGIVTLLHGSTIDLINQPYTLYVLAFLGFGVSQGLFIFIFTQFFKNLPVELEEAALIDGCGFYKTYFLIMFPNSKPSILTVGILSFIWNYGDTYYTSYFHPNGPYMSATLAKSFLPANTEFILNAVSKWYEVPVVNSFTFDAVKHAAALIFLIPLLIVYFFAQSKLVENMETSGIVG